MPRRAILVGKCMKRLFVPLRFFLSKVLLSSHVRNARASLLERPIHHLVRMGVVASAEPYFLNASTSVSLSLMLHAACCIHASYRRISPIALTHRPKADLGIGMQAESYRGVSSQGSVYMIQDLPPPLPILKRGGGQRRRAIHR